VLPPVVSTERTLFLDCEQWHRSRQGRRSGGFQCHTVFVNPLATNRGRSHGNRPAADSPV